LAAQPSKEGKWLHDGKTEPISTASANGDIYTAVLDYTATQPQPFHPGKNQARPTDPVVNRCEAALGGACLTANTTPSTDRVPQGHKTQDCLDSRKEYKALKMSS
jgi:hypothetical protein